MVKLTNINIIEFKEQVYSEYVKLFPKEERKSYNILNESYQKGILNVIKIMAEDTFVGFMITNSIKGNKYLQVDYLAILPEYQDKGYGTKALKALKEMSQEYNGIFIEVEKIGLGKNEKENALRKRRAQFYERIGFDELKFDFNLYNVIYTPYILYTSNVKENENKIIEDIFDIYIAILGEKRVKAHCNYTKW